MQPQVRWDLSPTGNTLSGWDRFDRTVDCLWRDYGGSTDVDRIQYGYDRASNRIWRKNTVAPDGGNDELYSYDGAQRLIDMSRGNLVESETAIDDASFAQSWQLDATGNWNGLRQTDVTTAANNLDQQRTSNRANEITSISRRFGTNWPTPVYDRAGNTTNFPQPNDPTQEFTATYDAWNRLISVTDEGAESPTAVYMYDGLNRRITSDDGTHVRHTYFTAQWQWLEERLDSSTTAERQALWGLRYIDDLVLRDRSPTNNGTLSERLYTIKDANWNTTAVVDSSGAVQERYRYSAYGTPTFLNPDFTPKSPNQSDFDWETLYCGYRFDTHTYLCMARRRLLQTLAGIWLTMDPIEYRGGINLFNYVNNNPLTGRDPLGLSNPVLPCCNKKPYNGQTHCCEMDTVVQKVSIWVCERPLDTDAPVVGGVLNWTPNNLLTPYFWDTQHSYICCDGPNLNCFGKQANQPGGAPTKKGDPIPREAKNTGTCKERKTCPAKKKSKCVNPVAQRDYGLFCPGYENCHDWAWEGVD